MFKKLMSSLKGPPEEDLEMLYFQCQISIREQLDYLKLWPPLLPTGVDAEYQQLHQSYQALFKVAQHMEPHLKKLEEEFDVLTLYSEMNELEQFIAQLEQILLQSNELIMYRQGLEAEYQALLKVREQVQQANSQEHMKAAHAALENVRDRRDAFSDQLTYFEENEIAIHSVKPTFEAFEYHLQTLESELDDNKNWLT